MPPLVDEDVVEDSEPEREALRQKRRLERKKRKEAKELHVQTVASVIELSDDDQSDVPPASASIGSVIEISDDSVSAVSSHSVLVYTSLAQNSRNSAKEVSEVAPVRASPFKPPLLKKKYTLPILNDSAIFNDSLANEDGDEPGLNLARFAFTAPPMRKASSSTVTSRADSVEPILKPAATKKSLRADRFAGDFTDAQLGSLLKCVCCNISWTTRKSAAQKMKHVQSCAKKNHFTDSAVRERIRQALESTDLEDVPTKGKGKAKGQDPSVPETYFHDIVHDAGPRKRTKRVDVPGTVKTLVDTRDAILQKAEAIIGQSASSKVHLLLSEENDREIMATQHFGRSAFAERMASDDLPMQHDPLHPGSDAEPYPATQAFGPSKFGVEPATPTPPSPSIDEAFPATQPFAPSKLGSLPIMSSGSSSSSSSRSSHSPIAPSLSLTPSSSNAPSPKSPLDTANRLLPLDDELPLEEGYHSDLSDACLHFYPDLDNRIENSSPSTTQSTPVLSAKGRNKKVTSTTLEKKSSAKDRGKGKGKEVKKRWKEDDFNASWEKELKENIMSDTELYQRILRYEPIEFCVFERLAGAEDDRPANGVFTLKLRRFLDDQAIHFYNSATPRGRRGKR
ncbi:uncharacterized protein EV420DRAFT_450704 [Desarmillaria tabescens]|uniref:Structure-specific endonuclease subunit SLX4 n=1 Tax=Armillaria tabescens TaxID=1929756 RepID=A0AA39T6M6_ARMTA|nr:uncharacterized protein EV420DRAFT_450704 [Desarmillaria tabescens]KAK0468176.1 hypothetical protein EV420DRAFT_450704 [Desarmillaria tabescens]